MIRVPHPIKRYVWDNVRLYSSLIDDIPYLYRKMSDEAYESAKKHAGEVACGDYDIYHSELSNFMGVIDDIEATPEKTNELLFVSIHSLFELTARDLVDYLGEDGSQSQKPMEDTERLYQVHTGKNLVYDVSKLEEIKVFKLIRNAIVHGKSKKQDDWDSVCEYANSHSTITIVGNKVRIVDRSLLKDELELIACFLKGLLDQVVSA